MLKSFLLFFLVLLGSMGLSAQHLNIGVKAQKTHSMYWENGVSAQYSFENFKPDQFYLGVDYVTSRLGTAFNSNALKQDNLTASAAWYFRKDKFLRVTTKLNAGLFVADLGSDDFKELPNSAFLLSPEFGLAYNIKNLPLAVNAGAGYNINLQEEGESPGTLQPLFYNVVLYYKLK